MSARRRRAEAPVLVDAAAVVVAWIAMLLAENVVLGLAWGSHFTAAWEISQVRRLVVPMAVAGLAPASLVLVGWWRVAKIAAAGGRLARGALGSMGGLAAACLALGVTHGRHFASWGLRGPFVAAVAGAGVAAALLVVPSIAELRRKPLALLALGWAACAAAWAADALVLPRLYPAFHVALLVSAVVAAGVAGIAARIAADLPARAARATAAVVAALVAAAAAWTPHAVRKLDRLSNVRIVLVEHAPLLGRAVETAALVRPPPGEPAVPAPIESTAPAEAARSLDWTGHDLVLLTVDALRADHVSAYGYSRTTTPNIDALAAEGTLFESAYCPTPHTSYSVTSMMTGKYLRPLLAMGMGEDSDTWARGLRLYGWRTAAFYPPAVFFIDEDRFSQFEREKLGFEYAKVEFADPALRERQVAAYLDTESAATPLFLWVHFFEPHEPYVVHPDHVFTGGASPDLDAYDSEVAAADEGIGRIVRLVRARRPGAVVIVTADHGEEFGEHGGRYHGTTVYEEQVRVPLVVDGPGVRRARVHTVVGTIDLLPTVLSALGIPRPARVRGRDLGALLAGDPRATAGEGSAFAETDDYALVASGGDRLICQRRAAACALYRPKDDPREERDLSRDAPARFEQLRARLREIERDHGRYEAAGGPAWPEALRRGMQGDVDSAVEVASLLDDADVEFRRKAGEVCFDLHAAATVPALRLALARDEDEQVRRWAALALARAGEPPPALATALLGDPDVRWRRRAALALGERGDARACAALAAWWRDAAPAVGESSPDGEPPRIALELPRAEELLAATVRARCRSAVSPLLAALADVRLRPSVADALGALGDARARAPLRALLAAEPYVTTRAHEARALLALGSCDWAPPEPVDRVRVTLPLPRGGARLAALLTDPGADLDASADGRPLPRAPVDGAVRRLDLPVRDTGPGGTVHLDLRVSAGGIAGLWLLPAAALD